MTPTLSKVKGHPDFNRDDPSISTIYTKFLFELFAGQGGENDRGNAQRPDDEK
jgi:hypothetical protein